MNAESQPTIQLNALTQTELLSCGITATGQWVCSQTADIARPLTFKEKANLRATFYWLKVYRPQPDSPPQEFVRGYLEAAHHLGQNEAWDLVQQILYLPVSEAKIQNSPMPMGFGSFMNSETSSVALEKSDGSLVPSAIEKGVKVDRNLYSQSNKKYAQPFHQQLGALGFYREQIELYEALLGKISPELDSLYLGYLGNAHTSICNYETAIGYYQRLLKLAEQCKSQIAKANALGGLGRCYTFWGQYQIAHQYCHKQLGLLESIQINSLEDTTLTDKPTEDFIKGERGQTLTALGYLAYYRKKPRKALRYFQESLKIAESFPDTPTGWHSLSGLAMTYTLLGKHSEATCTLQGLSQQPSLNTFQLNTALLNLTTAYLYQQNFQAAIECQQKLIYQSEVSGDIRSRCYALMYIAFIYFVQNKDSLVFEPLQQGMTIAQQYHYQQLQSQALAVFSCIFSSQRESQKAMDYAQKSLEISKSFKDIPRFEAFAYIALGFAYFAQRKIFKGVRALTTSLVLLPPWGSEDGKLMLIVIIKRFFK